MWDRNDIVDFMDVSVEYFFLGLASLIVIGLVIAFVHYFIFYFEDAMKCIIIVCVMIIGYFIIVFIGYIINKIYVEFIWKV